MKYPTSFPSWNRAARGAYIKGVKAAEAGVSIAECPYQDKRKPSGKLSWSRSFINAWLDGWNDYHAQQAFLAKDGE